MKNVEPLIKFAENLAFCACCEGISECDIECTIEEDSADSTSGRDRYDLMMAARDALRELPADS